MDEPPPLTTIYKLAAGDDKVKLWRVLNSNCRISHDMAQLMKIAIIKNNYFLIARLLNRFPQIDLSHSYYLRLILTHCKMSIVRLLKENLRLEIKTSTAYNLIAEIGDTQKFMFLFDELKLKIENPQFVYRKAVIHRQVRIIIMLIACGYIPTQSDFIFAFQQNYYNGMVAVLNSCMDKRGLLEKHAEYGFNDKICRMIVAKM